VQDRQHHRAAIDDHGLAAKTCANKGSLLRSAFIKPSHQEAEQKEKGNEKARGGYDLNDIVV
jgi:hypothetical protein